MSHSIFKVLYSNGVSVLIEHRKRTTNSVVFLNIVLAFGRLQPPVAPLYILYMVIDPFFQFLNSLIGNTTNAQVPVPFLELGLAREAPSHLFTIHLVKCIYEKKIKYCNFNYGKPA